MENNITYCRSKLSNIKMLYNKHSVSYFYSVFYSTVKTYSNKESLKVSEYTLIPYALETKCKHFLMHYNLS